MRYILSQVRLHTGGTVAETTRSPNMTKKSALQGLPALLPATPENIERAKVFALKKDDAEGMAEYDAKAAGGCCGFYDRHITVLGRPAMIGCNYGH
jgi:hypothetical protein